MTEKVEPEHLTFEQKVIVQADCISVLSHLTVYPIYYQYLCYSFLAGSTIKGYLKFELNITKGCSAIAPEIGLVKVESIKNGNAYFENIDSICSVRSLIPLGAPMLVFIPRII